MTELNDHINTSVSAATPFIQSIVDVFITPKLQALRDRNKSKLGLTVPDEELFTEYFNRISKKLAVVNTLVFNNSQRFLSDIYVPLTISATNDRRLRVKVDGFPREISDQFGNILITDTAGMGKSTLMKVIFNDIIKEQIGIPLFIELRRLNKSKKLIQEIQEQLNPIEKKFNSELLFDFLSDGQFIIILDGYDEIPLNERNVVTADIQDFISKVSKNRFFITSRPENALVGFGNFQEFRIEPLLRKEAFELLKKYDSQGQISTLLIKKLQEKKLADIGEFLTNPLLVSLLFIAFEHKQTIPFKKYLFYRQVFDANFYLHDLTKGDSYTRSKYCNLQVDDFHRVLRHIGFNCFNIQRIEFTKDKLLKLIKESKEFCVGLEFNESDFLLDILKTVPLFTQDGNYYRWTHKSLQEYFTAQFIYLDSKDKQDAILDHLYNHRDLEKFINVLDLYYDMDYKTFRNTIELKLLLEYKEHSEKNYSSVYDGVKKEDIRKRKELTFLSDSFLFKAKRKRNQTFDDASANKMLNKHHKANPHYKNKYSGILISPRPIEDMYVIYYPEKKFYVLALLANKKNPVVKHIDKKREVGMNFDIHFDNEFVPMQVIDSNKNEMNSKRNFQVVNTLLEWAATEEISIDHEQALKKIKQTQRNISLEKENDFFLSV